jgi:hypothetical protein
VNWALGDRFQDEQIEGALDEIGFLFRHRYHDTLGRLVVNIVAALLQGGDERKTKRGHSEKAGRV